LREQVRRAFVWLRICAKYASPRCAETLDVYLFLTPFAKTLPLTPGATLSVEHVNTAFTRPCHGHGEIVVYRAEEWFKVFLHETFHAFGFDFGTDGLTKAAKERLQHIFPIASKLDINESYTEVWARIVNCAMQSFYALPKLNQNEKAKETFMNYLEFSLNLERMFAIYQSQKMLEHMGLTFENFCKHPYAARYKENSHIFAYYIVTAVLLNNLPTFLQWCQTQNAPTCCFQFAQTAETQNALVTFIAKQVQQTLPRLNVACNRSLRQTTRMTVLG